jgi:hypothetical protein
MTKDNSIIKTSYNFEAFKQGANDCKVALLEMNNDLDVDFEESSNENSSKKFLEHRAVVISDIIAKLGGLSSHQSGFISALLEIIELNTNGTSINIDSWEPTCLTGKWQ